MSEMLIERRFMHRMQQNGSGNNMKLLWEASVKQGSHHILVVHRRRRNLKVCNIQTHHLLLHPSSISLLEQDKNIKDILKGGSIKEMIGCLISKFFIYDNVAPNKANSHHFKNMIIGE